MSCKFSSSTPEDQSPSVRSAGDRRRGKLVRHGKCLLSNTTCSCHIGSGTSDDDLLIVMIKAFDLGLHTCFM